MAVTGCYRNGSLIDSSMVSEFISKGGENKKDYKNEQKYMEDPVSYVIEFS